MKVAIDTLFLGRALRHTGTAVYLKNVLHECLKICEADSLGIELHGFVDPRDRWNQNGFASRAMRVHETATLGRKSIWFLGGMAVHTMRIRPDLVFLPTGQHSVPAPLVPIVTTILDSIPRRIPAFVGRGSRQLHLRTWVNARLATKIITISSCSKRDLVELYGVDPARIEVTYLGYDKQRFNEAPADEAASAALLGRFGIRRPFILHHGMVQLRKNVHRLIHAWDRLREQHKDFDAQLVLAGPMGFGYQEILRVREASLNRDQIILTGALPDTELATLVKNASLCVIPSLYEGFCLPLVESMACAVPTIASSSSCIPEVSGGVLEYFDPLSVEQMADTIFRVCEDSELRSRLSQNGVRRASEFSWERCARQTLNVFRLSTPVPKVQASRNGGRPAPQKATGQVNDTQSRLPKQTLDGEPRTKLISAYVLDTDRKQQARHQHELGIDLCRYRSDEAAFVRQQQELRKYFNGVDKPVVDLGCGRGTMLELFRSAEIPSYGIDTFGPALEVCRQKGLAVLDCDILSHLADLGDNSVGGIFCSHVIEHLQPSDALTLIREACRVITPGGALVLVTPNPHDLRVITEVFWLDPTHVRFYPARFLEPVLMDAGFSSVNSFEDKHTRYSSALYRKLAGFVRRLWLWGLTNRGDLVVTARK